MHSPEPWRLFDEDRELPVAGTDADPITIPVSIVSAQNTPVFPDSPWIPTGWDIERAIACVNFCQHLHTETILALSQAHIGPATIIELYRYARLYDGACRECHTLDGHQDDCLTQQLFQLIPYPLRKEPQ